MTHATHAEQVTWEYLTKCDGYLRSVEKVIDMALASVRDDDERWCANAFYVTVIKPLLRYHVGWVRGYPVDEAWEDVDEVLHVLDLSEIADEEPRPATNDNERLMRSSAAWDVVIDHLYAKLPYCRDCACF